MSRSSRREPSRATGSGVARKHAHDRLSLQQLVELQEDLDHDTFFSEGVLTPAQERRLDAIAGSTNRKIEWIGTSICEDLEIIAGIEFSEQRLAERKRIALKRIERKKDYLQLNMERLRLRQVVGTLCTVTLQRNAVSAVRHSTGAQPDFFTPSQAPAAPGTHVRIR